MRQKAVIAAALILGLWTGPAWAQSVTVTPSPIPAVSVGCVLQVQSLSPTVWICGSAGSGTVTQTGTGTAGTITKWSSDGVITNSTITESGSVVTAGTFNAANFTIGGANINTPGTLGNVVYASTAPTLTGTNFTGIPAAGVSGTAMTLSGTQTSTGDKTFSGLLVVSSTSTAAVNIAGALNVGGQSSSIAAGDISAARSTTTGYVNLGTDGSVYFGRSGSTVTLGGAGLSVAGKIAPTGGSGAGQGMSYQSNGLYLRGGTDGVWINSSNDGANLLHLTDAGLLTVYGSGTHVFAGGLAIPATSGFYPDGGGDSRIYEPTANTIRVISGGSGGVDLTSGATSWAAVSDERLKTDLEPISSAAWKLGQLRSMTGRYLADAEDVRRPFLIAQDVQAVLPEAVSVGADGMLTLRYAEVIPLLVGGVNEIERRLEAVEARAGIRPTIKASGEDARMLAAAARVDSVERRRSMAVAAEIEATEQKEAEQERRDRALALRGRLEACQAENRAIVEAGGRPMECVKSDEDRAELQKMRAEFEAAKAQAEKRRIAECEALNEKIVAQGGRPRVCRAS